MKERRKKGNERQMFRTCSQYERVEQTVSLLNRVTVSRKRSRNVVEYGCLLFVRKT